MLVPGSCCSQLCQSCRLVCTSALCGMRPVPLCPTRHLQQANSQHQRPKQQQQQPVMQAPTALYHLVLSMYHHSHQLQGITQQQQHCKTCHYSPHHQQLCSTSSPQLQLQQQMLICFQQQQ